MLLGREGWRNTSAAWLHHSEPCNLCRGGSDSSHRWPESLKIPGSSRDKAFCLGKEARVQTEASNCLAELYGHLQQPDRVGLLTCTSQHQRPLDGTCHCSGASLQIPPAVLSFLAAALYPWQTPLNFSRLLWLQINFC